MAGLHSSNIQNYIYWALCNLKLLNTILSLGADPVALYHLCMPTNYSHLYSFLVGLHNINRCLSARHKPIRQLHRCNIPHHIR